jgi:hypothetical protein
MVVFHPLSLLRVGSVAARMNAVIHLQVPRKGGNLFTSWKTIRFSKKKNCSKELTESRFDLRDTVLTRTIFCLRQRHGHRHICILRCFGCTDTDISALLVLLAALARIFLSILVRWLHWHEYFSPFYCFGYTDTNISLHFSALATLTWIFLSFLILATVTGIYLPSLDVWLHWHRYFCPSVLLYTDTDISVRTNAFAALTDISNEELHDSVLAVTYSQPLLAALILRTLANIAIKLAVVSIFSISEHHLPAGSLADDARSQDFPCLNRFFIQQLRKVFSSSGVPQAYILYTAVLWDVTLRTYV